MDAEVIIIRILYVLPGVLWVGGWSLMAWVIEPQLRAAGPAVQGPAMSRIAKALTPVLSIAGGVTILMGFALIARTPGHGFGDLFNTSWGWAIGLGLLTAFVSAGIGGSVGATAKRMEAVGAQITGAPTPAQASEMAALEGRLGQMSRIASVFGMISLALMVAARYV